MSDSTNLSPQQQSSEGDIDVMLLLSVLWGRKFLVAFTVAIGLVWGYAASLTDARIYQADALLQLEEKSAGISNLAGAELLPEEPRAAAEIEVFRSRNVMGTVVDRLDLTLVAEPRKFPTFQGFPQAFPWAEAYMPFAAEYNWGDAAITVTRFDIPPALTWQTFRIVKTGPETFDVKTPWGAVIQGRVGTAVVDEARDFRLTVGELAGADGRTFDVYRMRRIDAINQLQRGITIQERARFTSILEVIYRNPDRSRLVPVLNAVADAYVEQNVLRNAADVQQSLDFVLEQLPEAEARADRAQVALNAYLQQRNTVDLEVETESLLSNITEIRSQLNQLEIEEQNIQRRFLRDHPRYQELLSSREQLQEQLARLSAEAETLPETQKEVFNLRQGVEITRQIYLQYLNRAQELEIARASTIGNVRILDDAVAQGSVGTSPQRRMIVGGLVGGFFGTLIAFGLFYFRSTLDTLADLERTNLPLYGVVNKVRGLPTGRPRRGQRVRLLSEIPNTDQASEALRSIRTSLHFSLMGKSPSAISITSAAPSEGKTFVSVNLADVLAASGQRVCIVDTDMRRGYMRRYFNIERSQPGLSDVLVGDVPLEQALVQHRDTSLYVLTGGQMPPNPSELLMTPQFGLLVEELDKAFDLVIYDTAPVLAVTDPLIVMRHTPVKLMVVRHGQTEMGAIEGVKRAIARDQMAIDGVVVNGFDQRRAKGYGYGQYGYTYGYTGKYSYGDKK